MHVTRRGSPALTALLIAACGGQDDEPIPDVPAATDVAEEVPDAPAPPAELGWSEAQGAVVVENGRLRLRCTTGDGACELQRGDGAPVVLRAWSAVEYRPDGAGEPVLARSIDDAAITWQAQECSSVFGSCVELELTATRAGAPTLITRLGLYEDQPFVTVDLRVVATEPIAVTWLFPWRTRAVDQGGFFVGADPGEHVVLDNGQLKYLDFEATLHSGYDDTISNWNAAVVDRSTGEGLVAGWLSMRQTVPLVAVRNATSRVPRDPETGRRAFAELSFEAGYEPPRHLAPGQWLDSERAYLDPATRDPFVALEQYAERVRANLGYALWDGPVPNGWNSWAASGGTGGYGTSIDEALMLENLEFMAEHLRDYGMGWFQIDDGWQDATGDWNAHSERFPHGMKWFADEVKGRGLIPGIWIEPMTVSPSSALFAEHPEWTVAGPDGPVLDPSLPEVRAHLTALAQKVTGEWGFRWLKVDFAYRLLLASGYADSGMTAEEVYRAGMTAIKDGLAEGTFFLSVAAPGLNYDISHANRITLDTMPWWEDDSPIAGQGFKDVAATVARRWYQHGRAQITHPDLIVFREQGSGGTPTDEPNAMRPLHETIAFSTVVALCGGIVKIGDRMAIDLGAEQVDVLRRLLPVYPGLGRPLDVFDRTFPEVWTMPITTDWEDWALVGLINWGRNGSGMGLDGEEEQTRHHEVSLERLGLDPAGRYLAFEAWSETFLGEVQGSLAVDVEARHAAIVALREARDGEVRFLATNRHVTMGATDIESTAWDAAGGALQGEQSVVAGWPYRLYFHVPEDRQVTAVTVGGEPATWEHPHGGQASLLRLSFQRETPDAITWRVETTEP